MSLGPAGGSLLTRRRLSPRATPRTRSLHSLRNLPTRGAAGLAAVVLAGVGTLALQYSRKGPADDESAARMKEGDLKARFEDWAKKYNRTYRDEEEKAMRFQVFKDTIEWIESRPPSHRDMLRPLNCFADLKREEIHPRSCVIEIDDPETREYNKKLNEWLARKDKGERFIWPPVEQGDKQATQLNSRILSG
uniref:Uncharacterized protein n=1 Tax=Avena sativa TaxID=4498 RepID=A0ACD5UJC1_AVESA